MWSSAREEFCKALGHAENSPAMLSNHVRLIERETEVVIIFILIVKAPGLQHNDTFHVLRLRKLDVPFINIMKVLN